jgi:hypothetical protein
MPPTTRNRMPASRMPASRMPSPEPTPALRSPPKAPTKRRQRTRPPLLANFSQTSRVREDSSKHTASRFCGQTSRIWYIKLGSFVAQACLSSSARRLGRWRKTQAGDAERREAAKRKTEAKKKKREADKKLHLAARNNSNVRCLPVFCCMLFSGIRMRGTRGLRREGGGGRGWEQDESVCCLLVLDSVTSTPQWIRQPKPRDCVHDVCVFVCKCVPGSSRASQPLNFQLCLFFSTSVFSLRLMPIRLAVGATPAFPGSSAPPLSSLTATQRAHPHPLHLGLLSLEIFSFGRLLYHVKRVRTIMSTLSRSVSSSIHHCWDGVALHRSPDDVGQLDGGAKNSASKLTQI